MGIEEIKEIRSAIKEKGYRWSAGLTTLSKLPKEEQKKYLGLIIGKDEIERIKAKSLEEEALAASEGIAYVYPRKWDWRNVNGRNWTTSIKHQGPKKTCVAFAVVAAIESSLEIFKRNSYLEPDLSEADLFYGGGGIPDSGWSNPPALNYARDKGIPDEACFPYEFGPQSYTPCPDRDKRTVKIEKWREIFTASEAKEWLSREGPLMTGMLVYEDFFSYRGGIYRYTWGPIAGGHAVCVVGYDEDNQCWICKNSWGEGWGENGWFKIGYGECGISEFQTAEFPGEPDNIYMPREGEVTAEFLSKCAAFDNEFWLYKPKEMKIFDATDSNVGKKFKVGNFPYPQRLVFALKTPEGFTYYTDHSLNPDCCDHVQRVQINKYTWELKWEDMYSLGDRDFDDVIVKIKIRPR